MKIENEMINLKEYMNNFHYPSITDIPKEIIEAERLLSNWMAMYRVRSFGGIIKKSEYDKIALQPPTYPRSFQKTWDSIFDFLEERGWGFHPGDEEPNTVRWIDYKTNIKYFNSFVPYLIESLRLDSELMYNPNRTYIDDKDTNEILLNLIDNTKQKY